MKKKSFYISFLWKSEPTKLLVETAEPEDVNPLKSIYRIYWKGNYLFSIYPTIGRNSSRIWYLMEKEKQDKIPESLVAAVGCLIDEKEN